MKVVYLIDHYSSDLAGTENQLLKIINGLAGRIDVELVILRPSEWIENRAVVFNCPVTVLSASNFRALSTYRNLMSLVGYFRRSRPDLIHTFFPVANSVGVIAGRLGGVRRIVTSRRDFGEWMTPRYLAATKLANRFVTAIVTNSHEVKRLTERVEGYPGDRIEVIYNGIDAARFRRTVPNAELKERLGIPAHDKVIGIIGNFRAMKRHQTFVRAADLVLKRRRDVSFLLVGYGHEGGPKSAARSLAGSLGISGKVLFSPDSVTRDVREYLSIIDIGVNCSEAEGLSNAVMEYMCAEIPCIVSNSGGNPDLVTHEVNGLMFPLDDVAELARAMERLLDHPEECKRYAAAARARVEAEMGIDTMLARFDGLYRRLSQ